MTDLSRKKDERARLIFVERKTRGLIFAEKTRGQRISALGDRVA